MPEFERIHVCLVSGTAALEEHDDPDYPFDPIYNHNRYVQVDTNQQFRIKITLRRGFDFCGADVVRCRVFIDDDPTPFWCSFSNSSRVGVLEEPRVQFISTAVRQNKFTGGWEKMPFVFGSLKLVEDDDEDAAYVPGITPAQAVKLGSIRVDCWRAFKVAQTQEEPKRDNSTFRKTIGEEVLKSDLVDHRNGDKFLDNAVRFGQGTPIVKYGPNRRKSRYSYPRLPGRRGKAIAFDFQYRSAALLRSLGVIRDAPETPSANRSPSPLIFFTPEPDSKTFVTEVSLPVRNKRKREIDQSDSNGDVVMKAIEWKRARTGELLEIIDLTKN